MQNSKPISRPVTKKDHGVKIRGEAVYAADHPRAGTLYGKLVRSPHARARIISINLPKLPDGYFAVDRRDIPGVNRVHIVLDDSPVFAEDTVEYPGDPVLLIAGPDETECARLAAEAETAIQYEELPAIIKPEDHDTVFFDYHFGKGDIGRAFAEADHVYEETFETGYQEHAYLEPQGMIACFEDGKMTVRGSLQCPWYVHGAVAKAMGLSPGKVRIVQDVTGGGFGGKEAYPSILACQAAAAAYKAKGKPVRMIFNRREDLAFTSKRHPSLCTYKVSVKDGQVTGMDADILFNGGAFTTLSAVVLQRGIIAAMGVYNIENLRVRGRAVKTNTVPSGAYRGFGAPQTFFAVEMMMGHIAKALGEEPLAFKERHLAKQGDRTSTNGRYHFPVPLPAMIREVDAMSAYRKKRAAYNEPQSGRYRRGIGMGLCFHGAGFTGSGERDIIKAVVNLRKYADGRVEILASQSDIGQGIKTTLCKIAANELNLPLEKVFLENPDTDRVPDSGPTVASRSLMIVGELVRRAAINLRSSWKDGEEQIAEEHFTEPDFMIPFHIETFQGDAYPTYAWAAAAVELQVDTLTGSHEILGAWGSFDVGTPIDLNIVTGQMEGGFMQGLGYASMEQMRIDTKGRFKNISLSDYIIPTAQDIPVLQVQMHVEEYPQGPYGAKGAGELPVVPAAPAYLEALEQALDAVTPRAVKLKAIKLHRIPFSPEDTLKLIGELRHE